jgi:nicotinamidase-related amidase
MLKILLGRQLLIQAFSVIPVVNCSPQLRFMWSYLPSFLLAGLQLSPAPIANMVVDKIIPSRTALFLLDFQVVHGVRNPSFDALMKHTASVVKTARSKGITIAHCRVAFTDAEIANISDANPIFSQLKHDPSRAATYGVNSSEAAFHPAVAPVNGDIVVRKNRVGPFFNAPQDVHAIFKERGIDTLLIGGIATGGAVAATVVQAADLDYRLFVVEDSCVDPDQETHQFLMKFFTKRATVIKSDELNTLVT